MRQTHMRKLNILRLKTSPRTMRMKMTMKRKRIWLQRKRKRLNQRIMVKLQPQLEKSKAAGSMLPLLISINPVSLSIPMQKTIQYDMGLVELQKLVRNSSRRLWMDVLTHLWPTLPVESKLTRLKSLISSNPELLTALETECKSCANTSTVLAILKTALPFKI